MFDRTAQNLLIEIETVYSINNLSIGSQVEIPFKL
jgi:hypothetical protein